jgi:hypothetical protein
VAVDWERVIVRRCSEAATMSGRWVVSEGRSRMSIEGGHPNRRIRWRGQVVVAMGLAHGSRATNGSRATLIGMEG